MKIREIEFCAQKNVKGTEMKFFTLDKVARIFRIKIISAFAEKHQNEMDASKKKKKIKVATSYLPSDPNLPPRLVSTFESHIFTSNPDLKYYFFVNFREMSS